MIEETTTQARWDIPKQTIFGIEDGPGKVLGDCMRCCIAAVLQLPASEVPHFVQIANDSGKSFAAIAQEWLGERGFWLIALELTTAFGEGAPFHLPHNYGFKLRPIPMICCGPTVRSKKKSQTHAVVMEGGSTVYDPHPSEAGLLAVTGRYLIVPHLP